MALIEWAPLNIPLNRRLQTLCVCLLYMTSVIGSPLSIYVLYRLLYSAYWWAAVLYLVWIICDTEVCHRGGRISEWVRNWNVWRYVCDYFPIKLVKTAELDATKNYIFSCYPHGVASLGTFGVFPTNALDFYNIFPGLTVNMITLRQRFIIPFIRDLCLAWGYCSSSKESLLHLLDPKKQQGKCAILITGGSSEVLDIRKGEYILKLRNRKGFVRIAMMSGASLVPVLSFGENDLFGDFNFPEGSLVRRFQKWFVRVIGLIPVLPCGRGIFQYSFGLLPHRIPLTVVVGSPIAVERNLEPSQEEVDAVHAKFVERLVELFENHKSKYVQPCYQLSCAELFRSYLNHFSCKDGLLYLVYYFTIFYPLT